MYKPTNQTGQPLNIPYAEDIDQFVDLLTGNRDGGALSLLQALATPAAPTSVTLQSGSVTGTGYQWAVYWITGAMDGTGGAHIVGRTPYGTLSGAQPLAAQEAVVSISGLTPPTGVIGWGVARNQSPGGTTSAWYTVPNSEQFLSTLGSLPNSFIDNAADASLVTLAPTVNTTGTSLVASAVIAYGTKASPVSTTGTTFVGGADVLASALSFTADGVSTYVVKVYGPQLSNSTTSDGAQVRVNLDTADAGIMVRMLENSAETAVMAQGIITPTNGAHTVNVRLLAVTGGTATMQAGAGGVGAVMPILVTIEKL